MGNDNKQRYVFEVEAEIVDEGLFFSSIGAAGSDEDRTGIPGYMGLKLAEMINEALRTQARSLGIETVGIASTLARSKDAHGYAGMSLTAVPPTEEDLKGFGAPTN